MTPQSAPTVAKNGPAHGAVLLAGVLFGSTFVVMKDAVAAAPPSAFLAARFLIGAAVLAPVALRAPARRGETRAAAWCGAALLAGYVCQTVGLQYTTASISAFITYLLVVLVPIIAVVTARRVPGAATLSGVVLATLGLVLLTGHGLDFNKGELWTLGCAFFFAVHIVLLSEFSPRFDTLRLTALQLAVVGAGAAAWGGVSGDLHLPASVWAAAIYTGVAVSAVAFALQVWGQRQVGPTRTSLLLMIEPVAAAAFGYASGDRLGAAAVGGAALILAGIAVAEVPALFAGSAVR